MGLGVTREREWGWYVLEGSEGGRVQNEGGGWVYHVAEGRYTRSGWGLGVSEASGSVVYLGREWCVPEVVIQTGSWLFSPAGTCFSGRYLALMLVHQMGLTQSVILPWLAK